MLGWRVPTLLFAVLPLLAQTDGPAFFETRIRPLLVAQCLACHSASSRPIMGGLRLDTREFALQGGTRGPAIIPGNLSGSLLLQAVQHTAGALKMPPSSKLKDADVALLARWIQMGAPWGASATSATPTPKKYWAFVPPAEPNIPAVRD